jgi:tetratricopeptide (TPR) repeat protein/S1-C subfamily serine protease
MKQLLYTTLFLTSSFLTTTTPTAQGTPAPKIAQADDFNEGTLTPQQVQETAKNITVRITAENSGGSGVIIAQKGDSYLILTNAHVVKRATKLEIQAPDGQKYTATTLDGGFSTKYDLALLQFTSKTKYTLANLTDGSSLSTARTIYSTGFPFDSTDIRITKGEVSQLSDIPFDDGTQIGYIIDKGKKGIRQGMSGGAIFDERGVFLGINTISVAPVLPAYSYNDGSKPIAKLNAQYARANWGIPVYNFLTNVKADILYGYENLPKVQHQVTPTGYMAKLNDKARKMTVRIENSSGNGSGVIVGREGNSYYVLTAKHVVQNEKDNTHRKFTDNQIITYDQDNHLITSTVVAEGVDLAVVKFTSSNNYPVAKLGEYSPNDNDLAFVGGFPGREKINSPLWQWQLNPGFIRSREQGKLQTQNNQSFSNGYDLIYSSISYGGMSGGAVFDTNGNVIGIHGRGEEADLNSLGISIQTFTGLVAKLQIPVNLLTIVKNHPDELNSKDRNNVITSMQNIPEPQVGDDGKRWLDYGNQLQRTQQFNKSIVAYDKAISKNHRLLGNYAKALSLRNIEKYGLAESTISQAIAQTNPTEGRKYYYFWKEQSIILKELKKYDFALKSIDIAIGLESNDLTLLNEKAAILFDLKQYSEAIAIYDEIIRKEPETYAYYNRGLAKYTLGNKQAAIADYDKALTLNPKFAEAYNNRGNAKSAVGDNQAAIADYDKALALNPKDARTYNNRGITKFDLGDNQAAIADYNRAIALNPKYAEAYYNRGLAKSALGNKQDEIADYDRAISFNPKYAKAYYNRGVAKSALGDKQGAITDYDRAIALNPKSAEAYNNRGNAKSALGDKQGAISDYDRAIALNPKYVEAYNNRGNAKSELGNNQAGIADYDRAIALNPECVEAYTNRGNAKSALGDKQGAIADADRAIALNPKYAEAFGNRSLAKSALGNKQGAIEDMSYAAELFRQQGRMNLYQQAMDLLKKIQEN